MSRSPKQALADALGLTHLLGWRPGRLARVVAHRPPGARLEDVGRLVALVRPVRGRNAARRWVVSMPDGTHRTIDLDVLRLVAPPPEEQPLGYMQGRGAA